MLQSNHLAMDFKDLFLAYKQHQQPMFCFFLSVPLSVTGTWARTSYYCVRSSDYFCKNYFESHRMYFKFCHKYDDCEPEGG